MLRGNSITQSWHFSSCNLNDKYGKRCSHVLTGFQLRAAAYLFGCTWICWEGNNTTKKVWLSVWDVL